MGAAPRVKSGAPALVKTVTKMQFAACSALFIYLLIISLRAIITVRHRVRLICQNLVESSVSMKFMPLLFSFCCVFTNTFLI